MPRKTIKIPAPIASHGDNVLVKNYRRRPAVWERGIVCGLEYANRFGGRFSWSYTVCLIRRTGSWPGRIDLHVGSDGIRRVKQ